MKRIVLKIILCGMVATPAAVTPMNRYDRYNAHYLNNVCNRCFLGEEFIHLEGCRHRQCTDCLGNHVRRAIRNRNLNQVSCLDCYRQLNQHEVQRLLADEPDLQEAYNDLIGPRHRCPVCREENMQIEYDPEDGVIHVPGCWNHWIHPDCLEGAVTQALDDREPGRLRCPVRDCGNIMGQHALVRALANNAELLARYNRVLEQERLQQEIANDPENGRHCPTPNCNHAYLYRGAPQAMNCPECHQNYCENCLAQHPVGAVCRVRERPAEIIRDLADVIPCPRCQRGIEKNGGCNHMTCPPAHGGCGHNFCWIDLQPWGYGHQDHQFGEFPHLIVRNNRQQPAPEVNQPAAAGNQPIRRNYSLLYILGGVVVVGAGVAAYKLYKYLSVPKELPIQDLEVGFGNLLKEATRCKRLSDNGLYVRESFKNYFVNEEKNKAFASLDATKLAALKKIVDDLEAAFVAGHCEREYLALVEAYRASKDAAAANKLNAAQAPVATKQPQVKKAVSKKRTNQRVHQARKGK